MKMRYLIAVIVCFIIFTAGYYILGRPFARFNARFKNDIKQEYMIQDAGSRIQNYEWFYEQYVVIKSTAAKVELSEGTEKTSIKMILADQIAEYNARSKQTMTRANWKSDLLPYQLDTKDFLED